LKRNAVAFGANHHAGEFWLSGRSKLGGPTERGQFPEKKDALNAVLPSVGGSIISAH
jgi:hypothetical protein